MHCASFVGMHCASFVGMHCASSVADTVECSLAGAHSVHVKVEHARDTSGTGRPSRMVSTRREDAVLSQTNPRWYSGSRFSRPCRFFAKTKHHRRLIVLLLARCAQGGKGVGAVGQHIGAYQGMESGHRIPLLVNVCLEVRQRIRGAGAVHLFPVPDAAWAGSLCMLLIIPGRLLPTVQAWHDVLVVSCQLRIEVPCKLGCPQHRFISAQPERTAHIAQHLHG